MNKDITNDAKKGIIFLMVMAFLIFLVGGYLGTAGKGFSDSNFQQRYSIYIYFFIGGAIILIGSLVYNFISRKQVLFYPVNEPEESLVPRNIITNNILLLTMVGLCFAFTFAFYFAFFQSIFFSAIPQSVSGLTSVWSQSIFPLAENLFFFALVPFVLLNLNRKIITNKALYWMVNLIVIPLISAMLWGMFHNIVYGADEVAQFQTFIFGFMWVFLTMLTMSQIPALILHFFVNFASATRGTGVWGSDLNVFFLILAYIILLASTFYLYRYYAKRKKNYAV